MRQWQLHARAKREMTEKERKKKRIPTEMGAQSTKLTNWIWMGMADNDCRENFIFIFPQQLQHCWSHPFQSARAMRAYVCVWVRFFSSFLFCFLVNKQYNAGGTHNNWRAFIRINKNVKIVGLTTQVLCASEFGNGDADASPPNTILYSCVCVWRCSLHLAKITK